MANAPTVSKVRIEALVASLSFETARVPNTSSVVATARLPNGFVLAVGESHTVHPANFEHEEAKSRAIEDARTKAKAKLYEHEGYILAQKLFAEASQVHPDSSLPSVPAEINTDRAQLAALGQQQEKKPLPQHHQRVVDEQRELGVRIAETDAFISSPLFTHLSALEQGNLCRQIEAMKFLHAIMQERIDSFQ